MEASGAGDLQPQQLRQRLALALPQLGRGAHVGHRSIHRPAAVRGVDSVAVEHRVGQARQLLTRPRHAQFAQRPADVFGRLLALQLRRPDPGFGVCQSRLARGRGLGHLLGGLLDRASVLGLALGQSGAGLLQVEGPLFEGSRRGQKLVRLRQARLRGHTADQRQLRVQLAGVRSGQKAEQRGEHRLAGGALDRGRDPADELGELGGGRLPLAAALHQQAAGRREALVGRAVEQLRDGLRIFRVDLHRRLPVLPIPSPEAVAGDCRLPAGAVPPPVAVSRKPGR